MFSESVKNFLFGGQSNVETAKIAKSDTAAAFTREVMRIIGDAKTAGNRADNSAGYDAAAEGTAVAVCDDGNVVREFPKERVEQANDLMVAALETISKLLGLDDNTSFNLEHVLKLDPQSIEQLADIVWGIEKAIGLLEGIDPATYMHNGADFAAITEGVFPFGDIQNAGQLAEFMSQLRTAKSHLELGLYSLEMQDVVSEKVAEKYGAATAHGIMQAANPADLGMSISDLATVFQSLIREEMTSAVERLRGVASGQSELTELEKAALTMKTVDSAILKASIANSENPISEIDFTNVKLNSATANTQGGGGGSQTFR